jgi:hypothetical protein
MAVFLPSLEARARRVENQWLVGLGTILPYLHLYQRPLRWTGHELIAGGLTILCERVVIATTCRGLYDILHVFPEG